MFFFSFLMKIYILENKINSYFSFVKLPKNETNLCKSFAKMCSLNKIPFFFSLLLDCISQEILYRIFVFCSIQFFNKKVRFIKNIQLCCQKYAINCKYAYIYICMYVLMKNIF